MRSLVISIIVTLLATSSVIAQICHEDRSTVLFDLDACLSNTGLPSQADYSEFTAVINNQPLGPVLSVQGGFLYRNNPGVNMHSCTLGFDGTDAMCVSSQDDCAYVADSDRAIRFDILIEPGADGFGRLSELTFYESAVDSFMWINGASGLNNYPTRYSVRVLRNGVTVYEEIDIPTSSDWSLETFDFSDNPDFKVSSTSLFSFELLGYCTVGNGAAVNAWDVENVHVAANQRDNVHAGLVRFSDLSDEQSICLDDGFVDLLDIVITDNQGPFSTLIVTTLDSIIVDGDASFPRDFDNATLTDVLVFHVSHDTALAGNTVGNSLLDLSGCFDISSPITVIKNLTPISSIEGTGTTCGEPNGTATASAVSGTEPYIYSWNTGSTTATIVSLAAGTYTVTVTDSSGCSDVTTISIDGSTSPIASASGSDTSCGEDNGTATASATLGIAPYSYRWDTGSTTAAISGLGAGSYSVTVTDAAGCTDETSVTIEDSTNPIASATSTTTTCGEDNGTASASATSGITPYSYMWSNGALTAAIADLAAGTYTVTITDAFGCTDETSVTIDDSTNPEVWVLGSDTSCGEDNGSVSVSTTEGLAPYTYVWSTGATGESLSDLPAGTYTVTVTDAAGCTDSGSKIIESSTSPDASISGIDTRCGEDNGMATASATSGTPPYVYSWSIGSTTATISDLSAGTYVVTVTDAAGCTDETSVTIDDSTNPIASATSTTTTCGEDNGTASASATSGIAPYSYMWSNGALTAAIADLPAGTYTVTITDAVGCTDETSVTIDDSTNPEVWVLGSDTSCGEDNGSVSVSTTEGLAPYTYVWSTGATGESLSDLPAGTYTVTVTDAAGCTDSGSKIIESSTSPDASILGIDTRCGEDNGTATASATSGTAPYTYVWNTGATTSSLTNLSAGAYTVTITDAVGCSGQATFTVDDSTNPEVWVIGTDTSCGEDNGTATVSTTEGLAPFTYLWSTGATGDNLTDLSAGIYTVTVTDAAGCTDSGSKVIEESSSPVASATSTTTSCGDNDGTAAVSASSGTPPYSFQWDTGSTATSLNGLAAGTYSVTVTDAIGCIGVTSVTVGGSTSPEVWVIGTDTSCGEDNGTLTVSTTDGIAPFTYLWSTGATTENLSGLPAGTYTVTVTDAAGCTDSGSKIIDASTSPLLSVTGTATSCGEDNGKATASAINGTAPYSYAWNTGAVSATITSIAAGTYTVTVTDAAGCIDRSSVTVGDSTNPEVWVSGTDTSCGEDDGTVTASTTDGTAPFTYIWNTGATSETLTGLSAGTYTVTVTDAAGCTDSGSKIVDPSSSPDAVLVGTSTTCAEDNGTVSASASSGTAPYTYEWSTGATTSSLSNLAAGAYTVTVTDANGCTDEALFSVEDSTNPEVWVVGTDTSCGEDNGTLTISTTEGLAPYTYVWSTGAVGDSVSGLPAGTYSVTVTDAAGCTDSGSKIIDDSTSPIASVSRINTSCGEDNGAATATAVSGTGPYTYAWSTGAVAASISNLAAGTYTVTVTDAEGCLGTASVTINDSFTPLAGELIGGPYSFCLDGSSDFATDIDLTGAVAGDTQWIITENGIVTQVFETLARLEEFDFDQLAAGTCTIYHVAYSATFAGVAVGEALANITGCVDISNGLDVEKFALMALADTSRVTFSMEDCYSDSSDGSGLDYSELTGTVENASGCTHIEVIGGSLYREDPTVNGHSCTPGADGTALCVSSDDSCNYDVTSDKAIVIDIRIDPASNGSGRLEGLSFFEQAPENFDWINGATGPNNYPTRFAVSVERNGVIIFESIDLATERAWNLRTFDFDGPAFDVTTSTEFTIRLTAYCTVGLGVPVNAWDIDELEIISTCTQPLDAGLLLGGPLEVCLDGLPDFLTDITLTDATGTDGTFILVADNGSIMEAFPTYADFIAQDFEDYSVGTCTLYHVAHDLAFGGADIGAVFPDDLTGCIDISDPVLITKKNCGTRIMISPNPSDGQFTLRGKLDTEQAKVTIYNRFGQVVLSMDVQADDIREVSIDLTDLNVGLYHLRLVDGNKVFTESILIAR